MIYFTKFIGIEHTFNSQNEVNFIGKWHVLSDATNEKIAYEEVVSWAGNIGDNFRFPNGENDFINHDSLIVNHIDFKILGDNFTYEISFKCHLANRKIITLKNNISNDINQIAKQTINFFVPYELFSNFSANLIVNQKSSWSEENFYLENYNIEKQINNDYLVTITAKEIITRVLEIISSEKQTEQNSIYQMVATYQIHSTELANFSNLLGTNATYTTKENMIITQVDLIKLSEIEYQAKITAQEIKNEVQIGEINSFYNDYLIQQKSISYYIPKQQAENFINNLKIGENATWAGSDFYLTNIVSKAINNDIVSVNLEAKEIKTRIVKQKSVENFAGFFHGGSSNREFIYQSIWQVHVNSLSEFQNITGESASSWANSNTIVVKVEPEQISDIEYMITVEAQDQNNPELYKKYRIENNNSLASRVDLNATLVDFRFSADNCGYIKHPDGRFMSIPGWDYSVLCPIVTADYLNINLVNNIVKIIEITESRYYRNSISSNFKRMTEWGQTRVFYGSVAKHTGSYLRHDMNAEEIYDNQGNRWTKITCVYLLAPSNEKWNITYWSNK